MIDPKPFFKGVWKICHHTGKDISFRGFFPPGYFIGFGTSFSLLCGMMMIDPIGTIEECERAGK